MPYLDPEKARARRLKWKAANPTKDRDAKRAWTARNRDRVARVRKERANSPEGRRRDKDWRLRSVYGITHEQYDAMQAAQGGVCAICHRPETRVIRGCPSPLTVDHDHGTGAVRKLLCHRCNASLGFMDENPDRLRAMAAYIEAHKDGGA
jgi:hypothetical protein